MPNKRPPKIDEQIIREIARHPDGIGIEHLHGKLNKESISRRTLQRRLAQLTDNGSINALGKGRARRYHQHIAASARFPDAAGFSEAPDVQGAEPDADIPLSSQGKEIRNAVRQPRHQRRPVSYNQSFLADYIPNTTFYLSENLRGQLHELGRSHASGQVAGTFARDILNRLLIDLSWASSQLEGNTYNRFDTERLIEFGQEAEGKDAFETQMILNHKAAIEMLINESDFFGFNTFSILNLHALLADGLLANGRDCGRIRSRAVEIGGSVYLPLAMPQRINEIFHHILHTVDAIADPFEQAFFFMVHLPYLQPFMDVNKRVSRIAANIPFIKHNLCPLSFIDVPIQAYTDAVLGVYELN
ncbi:MAG: Fic family protein, partial [Candidatus Electrothrix sp. AR5]|nr:Fic family protein [Candidatus Electrothrix sp. AR5]